MITMDGKDYITIAEATEAGKCCYATIYNLVRGGKLKTTPKLGRLVLIDKKSWDQLLKKRKGNLRNYPRAKRTTGRKTKWGKLAEHLNEVAKDVSSVTLKTHDVRHLTNSEAVFSLRTFADSKTGTLGPIRWIREAGWYIHTLSLDYDKELGLEVVTTLQLKRIGGGE